MTVFDGNADPHCGGVVVVAVEEVRARDRARDSDEEEESVRSFMRVFGSGFRRGITRADTRCLEMEDEDLNDVVLVRFHSFINEIPILPVGVT